MPGGFAARFRSKILRVTASAKSSRLLFRGIRLPLVKDFFRGQPAEMTAIFQAVPALLPATSQVVPPMPEPERPVWIQLYPQSPERAGRVFRIFILGARLMAFPRDGVIALLWRAGEHRLHGDFLREDDHQRGPGGRQFGALASVCRVFDFIKIGVRF